MKLHKVKLVASNCLCGVLKSARAKQRTVRNPLDVVATPKNREVGDYCQVDGQDGNYVPSVKGGLVCRPKYNVNFLNYRGACK